MRKPSSNHGVGRQSQIFLVSHQMTHFRVFCYMFMTFFSTVCNSTQPQGEASRTSRGERLITSSNQFPVDNVTEVSTTAYSGSRETLNCNHSFLVSIMPLSFGTSAKDFSNQDTLQTSFFNDYLLECVIRNVYCSSEEIENRWSGISGHFLKSYALRFPRDNMLAITWSTLLFHQRLFSWNIHTENGKNHAITIQINAQLLVFYSQYINSRFYLSPFAHYSLFVNKYLR